MTAEDLAQAALAARLNAYAPFSNFRVGAALETAGGKVYSGCNVENATYGLTVCAERVALWKAISEGERAFIRIAVASDSLKPITPCGACRQLLWEFGGDLEVILATPQGQLESRRLKDLLPEAFDRDALNKF
ncbi:MAG TPA: cytidine deaminase [Terriglobia bacterium]|nr:cytidine deaminase [Terriglobia bacterium]